MASARPTFHFAPATGAFIGTGVADPDPMQPGSHLVPAFATLVVPPEPGPHEMPVWTGSAGTLAADWRGHVYWLPSGERVLIEEIGTTPPANALDEPPLPPIEDARESAKRLVDAAAEDARLGFITPGDGQAMTYDYKVNEAAACVSDPAPTEEAYPFLAACLGVDGESLAEVAAAVLARRDDWQTIGAQIERSRLLAKQAISNAADHETIEAVLTNLTWPVPAGSSS